jgi:hypothetical protein
MKKHFTILFILFGFLNHKSIAQITITSAQMPSVNDTIRYSVSNSFTGFNPSETGANYNWDFTTLESNSQAIYEYRASATTPYIFNFGFSAIGLKIADSIGSGQTSLRNVYSFFQKQNNSFSARGLGFQLSAIPFPLAGTYSSEDVIYYFPLDYLDSFSKNFALSIPLGTPPLSLGNFYRTGKRTTIVDGWGTISTPYKDNVPCLRVKSEIQSRDSTYISTLGNGFAFDNNQIEYKWLSLDEKIPMLEIIGNQIGNNFIPTSIRFRDNQKINNNTSINTGHTTEGVLIFPNPSNDFLQINCTWANADFTLMNVEGKKLLSKVLQTESEIIDLSNYQPGTYFIRITNPTTNQFLHQSIIKK